MSMILSVSMDGRDDESIRPLARIYELKEETSVQSRAICAERCEVQSASVRAQVERGQKACRR